MLHEPAPVPENTTSNRKSYQFMLYFKQKSQRVQHKSDYFIVQKFVGAVLTVQNLGFQVLVSLQLQAGL